MRTSHRRAFTLVELLVVIGIIALLISILIPVLGKARQTALSLKCLSNLRQCGLAFQMYASAYKMYLPYPTTTVIHGDTSQGYLWFNAIDPFLGANTKEQANRTGVAANRTYKAYKQCPVYETFEGSTNVGGQTIYKEFARSFKMNSHLRHGLTDQAKITEVRRNAEFVLLGDGISMDTTGFLNGGSATTGAFENGQFSMEVNDPVDWATPVLRHGGAANILFVDGHASHVILSHLITKALVAPNSNITIKTWESEYVNAAGKPVDVTQPTKTPESQGLSRNPDMPLIWSDPPRLYRTLQ